MDKFISNLKTWFNDHKSEVVRDAAITAGAVGTLVAVSQITKRLNDDDDDEWEEKEHSSTTIEL